MMNAASETQAGWCYSQSGTPCAYFMEIDAPESAILIPCDSWWQALRFSLSLSQNNGHEFVGGPNG